jgi:hypothetical protein
MRAGGGQQRRAVRVGTHQLVHRERPAGAGLGLDEDWLADLLADFLAYDAGHHIDAAAGCERHQQPDRTIGQLGLGECL